MQDRKIVTNISKEGQVRRMVNNPANDIKNTMWSFLMDKEQVANIPALKQYVYDLMQMTIQKTAGQNPKRNQQNGNIGEKLWDI